LKPIADRRPKLEINIFQARTRSGIPVGRIRVGTRLLQDRGIGYVNVDLPRIHGLPTSSEIVTADIAYVRFHGKVDAKACGVFADRARKLGWEMRDLPAGHDAMLTHPKASAAILLAMVRK
jgi:uncharacterized protein YecE (DUF72 family)